MEGSKRHCDKQQMKGLGLGFPIWLQRNGSCSISANMKAICVLVTSLANICHAARLILKFSPKFIAQILLFCSIDKCSLALYKWLEINLVYIQWSSRHIMHLDLLSCLAGSLFATKRGKTAVHRCRFDGLHVWSPVFTLAGAARAILKIWYVQDLTIPYPCPHSISESSLFVLYRASCLKCLVNGKFWEMGACDVKGTDAKQLACKPCM